MALQFVVEDGSGVSGATSYVALADADQYFENRPSHQAFASWDAASDDEKKGALNMASSYLDANYLWATGYKASADYVFEWPRKNAWDQHGYEIDEEEIPQPVLDAVCELAVRVLAGTELEADQTQTLEMAEVGPLKVQFQDGSSGGTRFPFVNKLLRGLITSSSTVTIQRG